jgi:hypothetical protein
MSTKDVRRLATRAALRRALQAHQAKDIAKAVDCSQSAISAFMNNNQGGDEFLTGLETWLNKNGFPTTPEAGASARDAVARDFRALADFLDQPGPVTLKQARLRTTVASYAAAIEEIVASIGE